MKQKPMWSGSPDPMLSIEVPERLSQNMWFKNHNPSAEGAKQQSPGVEAAQRPKPWVRIEKI
jgi:hypothetical protein